MNHKYDNSERLETVSDKQWRDALDELTAYLRWRLRGKTQRGAHSERELGMPALDYYQEEAVVKLIEGDWKWQDRFSLGKQLERTGLYRGKMIPHMARITRLELSHHKLDALSFLRAEQEQEVKF